MIHVRVSFLVLLTLSIGCSASTSTERYQLAIKSLAQGSSAEEAHESMDLLSEAGVEAFDVMLAHLGDNTPANTECMMKAMVGLDAKGNPVPYTPTVGEVCFDLIQASIEGVWPKAYCECHVLTPANVKDWLSNRAGKTLHELQVECAEKSLEIAKTDLANDASDRHQNSVEFLSKNLEDVRQRR